MSFVGRSSLSQEGPLGGTWSSVLYREVIPSLDGPLEGTWRSVLYRVVISLADGPLGGTWMSVLYRGVIPFSEGPLRGTWRLYKGDHKRVLYWGFHCSACDLLRPLPCSIGG